MMESKTSIPPQPIPEQKEGGQTDTDYSKTTNGLTEAHELFLACRERLLNINDWGKIAGALSAEFKLTDAAGNLVSEKPKVGYYIKIDIPGPGTKAGQGYDWVRIESIEEDIKADAPGESILIRVRPAENPKNAQQDVAHFFNSQASSSFTVHREGNTVTAGVHGRNEVPNTQTESLLDKTRNSAVAVAAIIGFNAPQWKSLVKGLLGD